MMDMPKEPIDTIGLEIDPRLRKDEFRFLWDEVKKLQQQVEDLEEAVNHLISEGTPIRQHEHREKRYGPGHSWKPPSGADVFTDEENKELIERLKRI